MTATPRRSVEALARDRSHAIAEARARMQRWDMQHGARLAAMHPDVAIEVRSLVNARIMAGEQQALTTEKDLHECTMRVASRMRIKSYRGSPPGDEEAGRQLREMVDGLGGKQRGAP